MADRIDDNADLAVTELKRKARRRLVGAIVLALAAAILLPLLLEKDPRPLGDDVSIQIPPVDSGKFVSRLSPEKPKDARSDPRAAARSGEAPAAPVPAGNGSAASGAANEPPATVPPPAAAKAAPAAAAPAPPPVPASAPSAAQPAPAAMPAPTAPAPVAQAPSAAAPVATAAVAASDTPPAAAAESRKPEGFIVQLAAFTDDKGADALANKLKKQGYPAYTEPVETSRGKLWRVRVGTYPTRAEANEALAQLKAEGHKPIVSAAK